MKVLMSAALVIVGLFAARYWQDREWRETRREAERRRPRFDESAIYE